MTDIPNDPPVGRAIWPASAGSMVTGSPPNPASWAAFILFAIIAMITVWQRDRGRGANSQDR